MELLLWFWAFDRRVACNLVMPSYVFVYSWLLPLIFNIAIVFNISANLKDECAVNQDVQSDAKTTNKLTAKCNIVKTVCIIQMLVLILSCFGLVFMSKRCSDATKIIRERAE